MVQEAELLYGTVQWDKNLLYPTDKMAAGLLFDIKCSEDSAVCQLHLPHCEVMDGKDSITGPSQPKLNKFMRFIFWGLFILFLKTALFFFLLIILLGPAVSPGATINSFPL